MEGTLMDNKKTKSKAGLRLAEAHAKVSTLEKKIRTEGKSGGAAVSAPKKAATPKGGR